MEKKTLKRSFILIVISIFISLICSFFGYGENWINFINQLFFISILLLMAGGTLFVLKGGMFDGMIYSFRRFYRRTSKLEGYVSDETGEIDSTPKNSMKGLSINPIIISGAALFIFSLIAAYM